MKTPVALFVVLGFLWTGHADASVNFGIVSAVKRQVQPLKDKIDAEAAAVADRAGRFELSLNRNAWFPGSPPDQFTAINSRRYAARSNVSELGRVPADANDRKWQLRLDFSNLSDQSWDGLIYNISAAGANLHPFPNLELSVFCSPSAPGAITLYFDLGLLSEDSNSNGRLNFEGNGHTFTSGSDAGIGNYLVGFDVNNSPIVASDPLGPQGIYPAGAPGGYWGEFNGQLDTEDLDHDEILDTSTSYYEYQFPLNPGWNYIKLPLTQYTSRLGSILPSDQVSSPNFLTFVKHARIWVSGSSSAQITGFLMFETIRLSR